MFDFSYNKIVDKCKDGGSLPVGGDAYALFSGVTSRKEMT